MFAVPRIICTLAFVVVFTLHSTAQLAPPPDQEFVYLGEQGELIVPLPNTARPLASALTVVRNDDGVVLSDWESSAHIASIKNSGEVTLSKTVPHGVTNMTQFPTTVTLANAKVATSVFAPGTVIARELSEGKRTRLLIVSDGQCKLREEVSSCHDRTRKSPLISCG